MRRANVNPLMHFVKFGWKEGRNPSKEFDVVNYLNRYPDVRFKEVNPLSHFIKFGRKEGRIAKDDIIFPSFSELSHNALKTNEIRAEYQAFLATIDSVDEGYIFISHDASKTGAPLSLLQLSKAYSKKYQNNFVILTIGGGSLLNQFSAIGPTLSLNRSFTNLGEDLELINLFSSLRSKGYRYCIVNSIGSATLKDILEKSGMFSVYLIHELPEVISILGLESVRDKLISGNSNIVFASEFVAKQFFKNEGYSHSQVRIIPQGVRQSMIFHGNSATAKSIFSEILGIPLKNKILILGCGLAQYLKGTDLFVETLATLSEQHSNFDYEFVWLGDKNASIQEWYKFVYPTLPFCSKLHFIDFLEDPAFIFKAADIFLLTSRTDSFPSVALEALANGTPVIMFKGASGIEELINETNGKIVDAFDTNSMARAIVDLSVGQLKDNFQVTVADYDCYLEKILEIFQDH